MKRARCDSIDSDCDSDVADDESELHLDSDLEIHQESSPKAKNPKRAKSGAATYQTSFKSDWSKEWPFITKGSTNHHYWCSICRVERLCSHQGKRDIERHIKSESHVKKTQAVKSSKRINTFFTTAPSVDSMTPLEAKVRLV